MPGGRSVPFRGIRWWMLPRDIAGGCCCCSCCCYSNRGRSAWLPTPQRPIGVIHRGFRHCFGNDGGEDCDFGFVRMMMSLDETTTMTRDPRLGSGGESPSCSCKEAYRTVSCYSFLCAFVRSNSWFVQAFSERCLMIASSRYMM